MKRAAVIGYPLAQTLSPRLHGRWLSDLGIDGAYSAIPVAPEFLEKTVYDLKNQGFAGVNVTIPHKETVIKFCDSISQDAQKIGAVNTILFHQSGIIEGHNHDAYGFITHARKTIPNLDLSCVLVLGAGGAARAILYALQKAGAGDIYLSNRNLERAESLAEEFPVLVIEWDDKESILPRVTLLVNATPCGMLGQPPLDIDIKGLTDDAVVYDIVYKPLMTDLLCAAQVRNIRIITGLGMLIHQAAPAFQSFFGRMPLIDDDLESFLIA